MPGASASALLAGAAVAITLGLVAAAPPGAAPELPALRAALDGTESAAERGLAAATSQTVVVEMYDDAQCAGAKSARTTQGGEYCYGLYNLTCLSSGKIKVDTHDAAACGGDVTNTAEVDAGCLAVVPGVKVTCESHEPPFAMYYNTDCTGETFSTSEVAKHVPGFCEVTGADSGKYAITKGEITYTAYTGNSQCEGQGATNTMGACGACVGGSIKLVCPESHSRPSNPNGDKASGSVSKQSWPMPVFAVLVLLQAWR